MSTRTSKFVPFLVMAAAANAILAVPASAQDTTTPAAAVASSSSVAVTTKRVLVQPLKMTATVDEAAPGLGGVMAEMLTTALLNRGVRVVERQQLGALEAEKNLGSGVLDTNSAQKTGRIKGASVAVIGTISEFGVRDVKKGALGVLGGIFGGAVKQSELRIKIDAHLVDIATGDILPGSQVVQEEKQVDTSWVGGAGTLFRGLPFGAIAGGSSNEWIESKAGKTARKIVELIADQIAAKIPKAAAGADEEETREVEVMGFADFTDADRFVQALKLVPGVVNIEANDFEDGVQKLTVTASTKTLKNLAVLLHTDGNLKPFGLKVSGINKARILLKK